MSGPACPYCASQAELVSALRIYPHRDDLAHKNFWLCAPCRAWVGCHDAGVGQGDATKPLGMLANTYARAARREAHQAFDLLWNDGPMTRKNAYAWLAKSLDIRSEDCHIGHFDESRCARVVELVNEYFEDQNDPQCAS